MTERMCGKDVRCHNGDCGITCECDLIPQDNGTWNQGAIDPPDDGSKDVLSCFHISLQGYDTVVVCSECHAEVQAPYANDVREVDITTMSHNINCSTGRWFYEA